MWGEEGGERRREEEEEEEADNGGRRRRVEDRMERLGTSTGKARDTRLILFREVESKKLDKNSWRRNKRKIRKPSMAPIELEDGQASLRIPGARNGFSRVSKGGKSLSNLWRWDKKETV
jgi:hypothetical protein